MKPTNTNRLCLSTVSCLATTFALFFLSLLSSYAQTNVCGFQPGVRFTLAGSPYTLTCTYTIPAGDSLVVEAGVQLKTNGNPLYVYGKLRLRGTQQDSVSVTGLPISSSGVSFQSTGTGTIIYTKFSGFGSIALALYDGTTSRVPPIVAHSRFASNGTDLQVGINTTAGLSALAVRPVELRASSNLSGRLAAYGPVSAYKLVGTLQFLSTDSLVVDAGVRLALNGNPLYVYGRLRLRGNQQDSVYVTGMLASSSGISFQSTGTGTITYTKFSNFGGVALALYDGSAARVPPVVAHSRFVNNGTDLQVGINTTAGLSALTVRPVELRASSNLSGRLVAYGPVSAYKLVGTLQLLSTDSLIVEAGVQLGLNGNPLYVYGKLRLRGTQQDSVYVTGLLTSSAGVSFQSIGTGTITYAKFSDFGGIALTLYDGLAIRVPPVVAHSRFAGNGIDLQAGINTTAGLSMLAVRPVELRASSNLSGKLVAYGPVSAYKLTGTLQLLSTDSLIIEAGVRLGTNGNPVYVYGKLRSRGTRQDSVYITGLTTSSAGISFQSTGTGTITYTKFSGFGGTALALYDGSATRVPPGVAHSRFVGNGTDLQAGINTTAGLSALATRPVELRASSNLSGRLVAYGPVSAYKMVGTLQLLSTDSLVVEAGVRLGTNGNPVYVYGKLRLRGTQQDSVYVTGLPTSSSGVSFQSAGVGTITYAKFNDFGGSALALYNGTSQNIRNCFFSGNSGISVSIPATQSLRLDNLKFVNFQTAMAVSSGTVTIGTSLFNGLNPKFGINATGTSSVVAINCNFGHPSGPYNLLRNPSGLGCQISNNVCLSTGATPVAGFDFVVDGNNVTFVNTSTNATTYSWTFGNGSTSTLANPFKNLPAGTYNVCLIAGNGGTGCNSATLCKTVSILGLASIETNHGGNTGAVSVVAKGGGFVPHMQLLLRRTGQADIAGDTVITRSAGVMTTSFNLTGKAVGQWNVVAIYPNGTTLTLPNGFTIEAGTTPNLWVNLTGDGVLRIGFRQVYTLTYGNRGNVDAVLVPIFIRGLPKGTVIELLDSTFRVNRIPGFGQFTRLPYDSLKHTILDSTSNTVYRMLFISKIAAGASGSLSLVFRLPNNNSLLHTFPIIRVTISEPTFSSTEALHRTASAAAIADCLGAVAGFAGTALGIVADVSNWKTCALGAHNIVSKIGFSFLESKYGVASPNTPLDIADTSWAVASTVLSCTEAIGPILFPEAKLIQIIDKYDDIIELAEAGIDGGLQGAGLAEKCGPVFTPAGESTTKPIIGNAWDPNTKYGPGGGSFHHYINKDAPLGYSINFENAPTANLNAQTVRVTDTLSTQAFNLTTFAFTSVTVGEKTYALPAPAKSFVHDFDFVSQYGVKARVVGTFDATTGIARWTIFSIDPATNQVTTNALAGFLPPDVVSPRGQGYVSFIVQANAARQTGDVIRNRASIVFDYNPPILTNAWQNVFDLVKPTSTVTSVVPGQANTLRVSWTGSDAGSGVESYDIYYKTNGRSSGKWLSNTSLTTSLFVGRPDSTYCFFSVARDSAGNVQNMPTTAGVCRTMPLSQYASAGLVGLDVTLYPNPTTSAVTVAIQLPQASNATLTLRDVVGREVYSRQLSLSAGRQQRELNINYLTPGVYLLQLQVDGHLLSRKLLKE